MGFTGSSIEETWLFEATALHSTRRTSPSGPKPRNATSAIIAFSLTNVRSIARVTSNDFIHWTDPVQMRFGDSGVKPTEHLYTNQTQPYFRAPHIYISMAARFNLYI